MSDLLRPLLSRFRGSDRPDSIMKKQQRDIAKCFILCGITLVVGLKSRSEGKIEKEDVGQRLDARTRYGPKFIFRELTRLIGSEGRQEPIVMGENGNPILTWRRTKTWPRTLQFRGVIQRLVEILSKI
jgi:hypothetical protein